MWQETTNYKMPELSTVFGVGAIWYTGLALIAAAAVVGASSVGDVVSDVILGMIFLGVAGVSARFARRSWEWPSIIQPTRTERAPLRLVRDEAAQDDAKAA